MKIIEFGIPCLVCLSVVLAGCVQGSSSNKGVPVGPRIAAAEGTPVLCCWFVEDNGSGKSGYAAADGRRGWLPPDGGGLFSSVQELRDAMQRQNIGAAYIEPNYDDEVPKGWKIRGLTAGEISALQNP